MAGYNQHEGFSDVLRAMGFIPRKTEADIWIRENNSLYEYTAVYVAVYVDDLLIAARNPKEIVQTLKEQYKFTLKGVVPLTYHFGCVCFRYPNRALCFGARKYITRMMDQFKDMYGCNQKEYTSALENGYHPEVDT
jgi:hypothetical protein